MDKIIFLETGLAALIVHIAGAMKYQQVSTLSYLALVFTGLTSGFLL